MDYSALYDIARREHAAGRRVKLMPFVYSVGFLPLSGVDSRTLVLEADPFVWCAIGFDLWDSSGSVGRVTRPTLCEIVRTRTGYRYQSAPTLVAGSLAGRFGRAKPLARVVELEPSETIRFEVDGLSFFDSRLYLSLIGVRLMPC